MELLIILLLIAILVFLVIVWTEMKKNTSDASENQYRILMKAEENAIEDKAMQNQFKNVLDQMQNMRKEQSASFHAMDRIENHMESMNRIMTNTKSRGNWGEYQLNYLLKMYCGSNPDVYTIQYTLKNGRIADAALFLPDTDKVLCIDSKFPMENYVKKNDRAFAANMKKHIDDITQKYINAETLDYAILFLPSEAIYQYICAEKTDMLNYALSNHVLLTSPTTLIGVLFTLLSSTKDFYRANHMKDIEKNILDLQEDVHRLCVRSEKAEKTLDTLQKQFHEVSTSANKVAARIERMSEGRENDD